MENMSLEERIAIRDSARCLKKYGSTSNYSSKRLDRYIKHLVKETDTLQGIALKYGVTMEDIRRANRLWANDSLFLREWLLIPSEEGELVTPSGESSPASSGTDGAGRDDSPADFLVRIDCAIASTKSNVLSLGDNSLGNGYDESDSISRRGKKQRQPAEVMVMSNGRKVRNSLQRLERESDEIFEL